MAGQWWGSGDIVRFALKVRWPIGWWEQCIFAREHFSGIEKIGNERLSRVEKFYNLLRTLTLVEAARFGPVPAVLPNRNSSRMPSMIIAK